jgi:hypothetical protein
MAGRTAGGTAPDTKNSSQARRKALARSCGSVVSDGIETVGDTPTHYPGAHVSAVHFDVPGEWPAPRLRLRQRVQKVGSQP